MSRPVTEPSGGPISTDAELARTPSLRAALAALPALLTADEVAAVLRTTRAAIYARAERGQLPGLIRDGRRLLVDRAVLLRWLDQRRAPSPGGSER